MVAVRPTSQKFTAGVKQNRLKGANILEECLAGGETASNLVGNKDQRQLINSPKVIKLTGVKGFQYLYSRD